MTDCSHAHHSPLAFHDQRSQSPCLVRTIGISAILLLVILVAFRIVASLLWPMALVGVLVWLLFFRR